MQIRHRIAIVVAATCFAGWPALGQTFDSGSICATDPGPPCLGDDTISANTTVPLPPDGILHYGSLTIDSGIVLDFTPNALNTPVYILASGPIVVNGIIRVDGSPGSTTSSGAGGPGGFPGGTRGFLGDPGGAGLGPGGGAGGSETCNSNLCDLGGYGSYRTASTATNDNNGAVYGSALLVPLTGGSGGGGTVGYGGGGGGGAILLASNVSISIAGQVGAYGGGQSYPYAHGAGSGGAIRLVAPLVNGSGGVYANGGSANYSGGSGRTRVDVIDRSQLANLGGVNSIGAYLRVFLEPRPRLDIVQVADEIIPAGTSSPVDFSLPFEAPATQTVIVQATDFPGVTVGCAGPTPCLPIRVALIPDTGPVVTVDDEIDLSGGSPAQAMVDIDFPANVPVRVQAWTH